MNIKQILDMEVVHESRVEWNDNHDGVSHFDVNTLDTAFFMEDEWDKVAEHIMYKFVIYHNIDGRRIWALGYATFDDIPFMIIQNAGREGDDHVQEYIFNEEVYEQAVELLLDIQRDIPRGVRKPYIYNIEEHNENLNSFYGLILNKNEED